MAFSKDLANVRMEGKQVFSHAGKDMGVVKSSTTSSFDVQKRWFGYFRRQNRFLHSQIESVNEQCIILEPSNDEYWQSPGVLEESYEGRYFVLGL